MLSSRDNRCLRRQTPLKLPRHLVQIVLVPVVGAERARAAMSMPLAFAEETLRADPE
jgi:hypothetical protein